jgi:hypothetical protein
LIKAELPSFLRLTPLVVISSGLVVWTFLSRRWCAFPAIFIWSGVVLISRWLLCLIQHDTSTSSVLYDPHLSHSSPSRPSSTLIGFRSMAKLAIVFLLAVAASTAALANGPELPTQIKVT